MDTLSLEIDLAEATPDWMRHAALNFDRQNASAVTIFLNEICNRLAERAKRKSQPVRDDRDDDANPRHLQA